MSSTRRSMTAAAARGAALWAASSSAFAVAPRERLSTEAGLRSARGEAAPSRPGQGLGASACAMAMLGGSLAPATVARGPRARRGAAGTARAAGPVLTLGTRGSPLALAQAYEAKRRLGEAFPELAGDDAVEIRIISTTGDQRLEISLAEIGGKGLFTRELDVALASKEVDFCVHSTKDVPTELIPDTELCTMLPREDTRDVLISGDPEKITCIEDFPDGSLIGTASLRRQAQIYSKNPNVKCVNFRGNVQTRLRKLQGGDVKGTFLAYAGLKRMSMEEHATKVLEWDEMLPAIAQGAISFQCRSDDERVLNYLKPLSHDDTFQAVTCERAFLAALDGNCKTPIAGQAKVVDGELHLRGLVASPDGQKIFRTERKGKVSEATEIGTDAGMEIRKEAGEAFFQEMQDYVQEVAAANTKPVRG
eukprot:Skav216937  [mRNA]  locus=scaffold880:38907:52307:- [translate_table: standard]